MSRCWIFAGFFLFLLPQAAGAKVYALTVGIDNYVHIPHLEGAVNDSNDIAETLRSVQRAEVVQLLDQYATKESIRQAWAELTLKAGPGDYLVLHIAGHGAVQPAIFPEAGELLDNMYLLTGFDIEGKGTKERIVDNEFAYLFQMEKEATVLFIADTCFSGTLARSAEFGPNLKVRRLPSVIEFREDQLKDELVALGPPPPASSTPNLFEIYAGGSGKTIPEVNINNQMRGALSYSIARALEGQADRSNDQVISATEIRRFIRRKVREHANGLQYPETNADPDLDLAFPITAQVASPFFAQKLNLFVSISDRSEVALEAIVQRLDQEDVIFSEDLYSADLILEFGPESYQFFNSTRDLIFTSAASVNCDGQTRQGCDLALLQSLDEEFNPVLAKEAFLRRLAERPLAEDIHLSTRDSTTQYTEGERIGVFLQTERSDAVILFALDKYGEITALVDRPISIIPSDYKFIGESTVERPLGADHLFAVTGRGASNLSDFAKWLQKNNKRKLTDVPLVQTEHRSVGSELLSKLTQGALSVGSLPIFTVSNTE